MESKLKDFVSTYQKQNKPKIITVADEIKRLNKNEKYKMDLTNQYNKLAFLTPTIVDLCDTLRESTECKKELKYYINQANKEAQKILAKHYKMYESYGTILNHENGNEMSTEDIYNITSKAYDFLLNKSPHEICCIAQIIREAEKSGLDYTAIEIPFTPL